MALLQERLRTTRDLVTDRGADNTSAGTLSDVSTTDTSFIRFTNATAINSFAGGVTGKRLVITNANSVGISLVNDSGGTAANRIITGTGGNVTIAAGASAELLYDDAASRWRLVTGAGGTGDVTGPASAVSGNLPSFNGTSGKSIQDSGKSAAAVVTGPASSVDSEIALFDSTTGKIIKRATGTGYVKAISGVYQTPVDSVPSSDVTGRTNGSAPAAGRIGELIESAVVETSTSGVVGVTLGTLALTAGVWAITFSGAVTNASGTITACDWTIVFTTNSALNPSVIDYYNSFPDAVGGNGYAPVSNQVRGHGSMTTHRNIGSSTTYYLRGAVTLAGGGSIAIKGFARAVRVA